jgi:DNA-binding NarL/FixJ family response regulator
VIRVVLADDQALVRGGFRMILAAQPDIEVVAEAQDGAQAVAQVRALRPDVVLMDVRMPVMDGLEATRRILSDTGATTRVVVVTTFDLDEYVYQALRAGASGFLLKETRPEILADAIRTVAGGEALLAPAVMHRLIEQYATREATHLQAAVLDRLTEREVDVLRLVGRGRSNSEIARELFVAETTVKTHITRIFGKLDLRDRAQAVVVAYETGLVEIGQAQ